MDGGAIIFNVGLWHYGSGFDFLKAVFEEVGIHVWPAAPLPVPIHIVMSAVEIMHTLSPLIADPPPVMSHADHSCYVVPAHAPTKAGTGKVLAKLSRTEWSHL